MNRKKGELDIDRRRFLHRVALVAAGALRTRRSNRLRAMPIAQTEKHSAEGTFNVVVDNFSFGPAHATVAAGTKVTWTNRDDIPHNVVSVDQKFRSPVLDTDDKFSHRFDTAGSYKYYCSIHPRMVGEIVLR